MTENVVGIFVSSTFRDMQAERDCLVALVFPILRERLEMLGLNLRDVDLRWGVPRISPDGEIANSWDYCRRTIDSTKPIFISFLGERYGHVPSATELAPGEPSGLSITELEIRRAVADPERNCFFYFRDTCPSDDCSVAARNRFLDPANAHKLDQLKAHVRRSGRPVRTYACRWDTENERFVDMNHLAEILVEDLWSAVIRDPRYISEAAWRTLSNGTALREESARPVPEEIWKQLVASRGNLEATCCARSPCTV